MPFNTAGQNANAEPNCQFRSTTGSQDAAFKFSGLAADPSRMAEVAGSVSSSKRFVSPRRSVFFIKSRSCSGVTLVGTARCWAMSWSNWSTAVISRSASKSILQVEMTPLVGLAGEPVLAGENKER
jgi:hypothetical protein